MVSQAARSPWIRACQAGTQAAWRPFDLSIVAAVFFNTCILLCHISQLCMAAAEGNAAKTDSLLKATCMEAPGYGAAASRCSVPCLRVHRRSPEMWGLLGAVCLLWLFPLCLDRSLTPPMHGRMEGVIAAAVETSAPLCSSPAPGPRGDGVGKAMAFPRHVCRKGLQEPHSHCQPAHLSLRWEPLQSSGAALPLCLHTQLVCPDASRRPPLRESPSS